MPNFFTDTMETRARMKIVKRVKNKRRAHTRATSGATRSGQSERIARSGAGKVAKHPISSLTPHRTMGIRTRTNRVQKRRARTRLSSSATRLGQGERIARSEAGEVAKRLIGSLTSHRPMGTRERMNKEKDGVISE
jgi:hypothetical protein